ncbi:hypothetical protein QT351_30545 (plasmid) [Escherichia coli]|nr:hypothetical protein [Escherichia coli]MDM4998370.1 hypothetical protein [Escherichia coli]
MIQRQAVEAACQPARKPLAGWLPAGREAGHAGASPVTLPVCDVSGMFFSDGMTLFLLLLFFSLLP